MANVSVTEQDFCDVADAANDAQRAGDKAKAARLDKLARKINAAMSNQRVRYRLSGAPHGMTNPPLKWLDVPSTLQK